jgi:hypothetical protein
MRHDGVVSTFFQRKGAKNAKVAKPFSFFASFAFLCVFALKPASHAHSVGAG